MSMTYLTRRAVALGLIGTLPGCATLTALNGAPALPTYDLAPVAGTTGPRRSLTLVVARPEAPAAIDIDRILIKPNPLAIAYLADAKWADAVPALVQSVVIRSIAGAGRLAHVGSVENGPVPDLALLLRIDAFQAEPGADTAIVPIRIAMSASLIRDRDQRLMASRDFIGSAIAATDDPGAIVPGFQRAMDGILPRLADWTADNARG
ncbi:ABC-type transport auxiliary lipoprotein family protein [Jannaschia donghaensis]|uniref:ABC-type uncharacterized transport system, auxiliary component n=1 Tax=Jannaschia donghaensis TaxID=420998 RepID=A0A0M6YKK1_9RHOB|nr:ABC-type transport auxiliary lipoprotein family protein [Jannaschia donghaensis]CTQ50339.1 ABC-type uncharacterized transport system, auxiliary component [Jannaschia donghaensis]